MEAYFEYLFKIGSLTNSGTAAGAALPHFAKGGGRAPYLSGVILCVLAFLARDYPNRQSPAPRRRGRALGAYIYGRDKEGSWQLYPWAGRASAPNSGGLKAARLR
jgi:hypothetical protein